MDLPQFANGARQLVTVQAGFCLFVLLSHTAIDNSVYVVLPQDSGGDGAHLSGYHSLGNSTHRGGGHLPLGVNQRGSKLPPEGHL